MARLIVYVETSVWSFAFADDAPDYREDTLAFFDRARRGEIDALISTVVLDEIDRAELGLREKLTTLVREISPAFVELSSEALQLSEAFVRERTVPASKPEDARHVAIAFAEQSDVLVSWNFRHIASVRRAERFNAVALLEGFFKPLRIVSPSEVLYDIDTA